MFLTQNVRRCDDHVMLRVTDLSLFFFSTRDNICWGATKDDISGCFPVSSRVCRFDPFLHSKQVELIPVYENNNNMHDMICVLKYI